MYLILDDKPVNHNVVIIEFIIKKALIGFDSAFYLLYSFEHNC